MQNPFFRLFLASLAILCFSNFFNQPTAPVPTFLPNKVVQQPFTAFALCNGGGNFILNDSIAYPAPLFDDMGAFSVAVTTKSKRAQKFFDQGLKLSYGFNHSEAIRSFKEAAKIDPNCAMAYWGEALALGPNINDPAPNKERERAAWKAITMAKGLSKMVSKKEEDLIHAFSTRYMADTAHLNRDSLNLVYRDAMWKLSKDYPLDNEVQTLFAASIMNTMPWDYYTPQLQAKEHVPTAIASLEKVIANNPEHPGAHHYYIHIVEASDNPDRGVPSADALGALVPGAGHLVHMPAHIYARVGRYADAANSNIAAILADEEYIAQCQAEGVYPLGYYPHNIHFLWMATSFQGKEKEALDAAEKIASKVPIGLATDMDFLQEFLAVPLQAYVRFGKWNDILTTPIPAENMQQYRLFLHYARGVAFTRKGLYQQAQGEIDALLSLKKEMLPEAPEIEEAGAKAMSHADSVNARVPENMMTIALNIVKGELAAAQGDYDTAVNLLVEAVTAENDLPYDEPPTWHQPVRHVLGGILVEAERYEEGIAVYQQDLKNNRDNGWSLFGLQQCLEKLGKKEEARKVKVKFEKAWSAADVQLTSSRF